MSLDCIKGLSHFKLYLGESTEALNPISLNSWGGGPCSDKSHCTPTFLFGGCLSRSAVVYAIHVDYSIILILVLGKVELNADFAIYEMSASCAAGQGSKIKVYSPIFLYHSLHSQHAINLVQAYSPEAVICFADGLCLPPSVLVRA